MTLKTYRGGCHCGRIRFEADIDIERGTGKCNCSFCGKTRYWGVLLKPDAFRLETDEDAAADYQFNTRTGHHRFCPDCGLHAYGHGSLEVLGGAYVSVNLACLDALAPSALAEAPVRFADGLHDNWMNPPAETRHL